MFRALHQTRNSLEDHNKPINRNRIDWKLYGFLLKKKAFTQNKPLSNTLREKCLNVQTGHHKCMTLRELLIGACALNLYLRAQICESWGQLVASKAVGDSLNALTNDNIGSKGSLKGVVIIPCIQLPRWKKEIDFDGRKKSQGIVCEWWPTTKEKPDC